MSVIEVKSLTMSSKGRLHLLVLFAVFLTGYKCYGDIYMHNPRGSNNRLDEQGRERNNGNRLFDSQNNDRGGYNVGSLYYYEGSLLPIEWTNQHSCGGPNSHCELIIQYMCDTYLRDGATTTTIPDNPAQCDNYDCTKDLRFGMHEDFNYYAGCVTRERNKGLFLADQNPNGETAKYTRQNPGGTRRGYECPEERDYYPYWHPTPWKDIAVLTNDVSRCKYYQAESENVKARFYCKVPYILKMQNIDNKKFIVPNNEEDCKAWKWPENAANGTRAEWVEAPSHDLPAPICQETEFSRDNHLGNGMNGYPNLFNWTIPAGVHMSEKCAVRIRYNISTGEYDGFDGSVNASLNEVNDNEGSLLDLSPKYGLPSLEVAVQRGYVLENNPQVQIFNNDKFKLQLAINTAQFGRTFQDRSHVMAIMEAPAELEAQRIYNLNVRGKRGNIVQVYPAVEYDFVPNTLLMSINDYVHVQWTGSNTNPHNNDGQGLQGTDRSNIVLQADTVYSENSGGYWDDINKQGHWGRSYPENLDEASFLGFSRQDLTNLALLSPGQFRGELSELDDAGTYFDLTPRKITQAGVFHYMCTRNNNFSNRSQKGKILVSENRMVDARIGATGGSLSLPNQKAVVTVEEDVLPQLTYITLEEWSQDAGQKKIEKAGQTLNVGSEYASDFIVIKPEQRITNDGKSLSVSMKLHDVTGSNVNVYRSNSAHFSSWELVDSTIESGVANFKVSEGGVYVARSGTSIGVIVGAVVACVVIVAIILAAVIYFRRNPEKAGAVRKKFRNAKRGTQAAV